MLACAALSACGGGSSGENSNEPAAAPHWVVLGSSTAAGVGASQGQSWTTLLDSTLRSRGLRLDNRARSGATTYQALPRDTTRSNGRPATDPSQDVDVALMGAPRTIILAFPSNDATSGFAPAETIANLLLMQRRAQQRGVAVLVLSSQPRDDASPAAREAMNASDAALAAALGACFVPLRADLTDAQGRLATRYAAGDGVHLNNAGHRLIFNRLWDTVTSGLCLNPP